jgi:hypothetical protein
MTRRRSKIALMLGSTLLVVLVAGPTTTASAASAGQTAGRSAAHGRIVATVAGSTHVLLGPGTFGVTVQQDPLAYEAVLFADGTVQGHWRYDYYESGAHLMFSGPVSCMAVQGNRAWIGGPIAKTTDPTSVGLGAWWQVADLGSGRHPVVPDRTTFAGIGTLDATQAYCDGRPDPHFIFDVQSGGVVVRDLQSQAS